MKTAYIIQPGKLGDLIVTTPIAKFYYDKGYKIKWAVFNNFLNYFKYFDFIEPITYDCKLENYHSSTRANFNSQQEQAKIQNFYINAYRDMEMKIAQEDLLLDISWGFFSSPMKNNCLIKPFDEQNRNWIDMRYHLGRTPLKERWNFSWIRNEEKEDKLLNFIKEFSKKKYGSEKYSICHNYSNNLRNIKLKNQINFSYIEGYEIFDWYKVLLNAESIACVDSSLCNFVEVIPELKEKKKYYLGSEEPHYFKYMRNILLNNWHDEKENLIINDYKV